jgi:hypothetical protein
MPDEFTTVTITNPMANQDVIYETEDQARYRKVKDRIIFCLHAIYHISIGMAIPLFWISDSNVRLIFVIVSIILSVVPYIMMIECIIKPFVLFVINCLAKR